MKVLSACTKERRDEGVVVGGLVEEKVRMNGQKKGKGENNYCH